MDWNIVKETLQTYLSDVAPLMDQINTYNLRKAAVLLLLFEYEDKVYILLTKRSEKLKSHTGEVCCPGGKQDLEDSSLEATALRETYEEIGIPSERIEILGSLVPNISKTLILVTPFVGVLRDYNDIQMVINEHEVGDIFACELEYFSEKNGEIISQFSSSGINIYTFSYQPVPKTLQNNCEFLQRVFNQLKHENYIIFGLTAHFIITFLQVFNSIKSGDEELQSLKDFYAQSCFYAIHKAAEILALQTDFQNKL